MQRTKIGYLTHTWNPIAMRCTPVSEGCKNCWHLRMAKRLKDNFAISGICRYAYAGHKPWLLQHELSEPLHVRKPARIGVQFMGDLFHESVPDNFITDVFKVINRASQHTFLILTKRPERMRDGLVRSMDILGNYPLKNLWLGVSVEDQKTADERIPLLLQTTAAVRFVSYEPALGPVDFNLDENGTHPDYNWGIDWLIMGGESGPGARPMHPDWARSVRDQCKASGTAFYFKQWGEWSRLPDDTWGNMLRVGHKRAGRLLDGKEYSEIPGRKDGL